MPQPLHYLRETASQTAGPYVHIGLAPASAGFAIFEREIAHDITGPEAHGERIRIEGQVLDGTGTPVREALIEVWQANAAGIYAHPADPRAGEVEPGFLGWGRVVPDFDSGLWRFDTVKPGSVPAQRGRPAMAPHMTLWIVARGINIGLATRMYFAEEAEANAADPVLGLVEPSVRRGTLVAERTLRDGLAVYRFDIRLQGEGETVFFDI